MSLFGTVQSHITDFEEKLYTSCPAIVEAYDPERCTVDVFPSIYKINDDGLRIKEPLLRRVPLKFQSVNNAAMTFPVQQGDKVLLVFCHDNIDSFFTESENFVPPKTKRKHSINDAIAFIGITKFDESPVRRAEDLDIYFNDNRITIKADNSVEVENAGGASVVLTPDGNIQGVVSNTFSMRNDTIELVDALSQLTELVSQITVNTVYGPSPINNRTAVTALQNQIDTLKE